VAQRVVGLEIVRVSSPPEKKGLRRALGTAWSLAEDFQTMTGTLGVVLEAL
jgi:hypothetical protein